MTTFTMLLGVFSVILKLSNGSGNFTYPNELPSNPLVAASLLFQLVSPYLHEFETPQIIRMTAMHPPAFWNCMAVYHPTLLDALTNERPVIVASDDIIRDYGTDETMFLCSIYTFLIVDIYHIPEFKPTAITFLESYGLDPQYLEINADVLSCSDFYDENACLQEIARNYGFVPDIMASIIAYQNINYLNNDGWNADGKISTDGKQCTANCRAYGDITNYKPCTKDPTRWQPMVEDNGKGFFYHYDHVVPHIGQTAKLRLLSREELEDRTAPNPDYDYDLETDLVIDRLADLANNDTMKMLVEFFDDKLNVANLILTNTVPELFRFDYKEWQLFFAGYPTSEYDAVITAWKEKREWDLVRPTTVIKRRGKGKEKITTYGGPYQGLKEIRSRDFESYHRVMPHSEYPSGSGCICISVAQYALKYLQDRHGLYLDDEIVFELEFSKGSSQNEPGVTPKEDIKVNIYGFEGLYKLCGETRLWGGMHFTASIDGAYEICQGIGEKGYEYVTGLLNGEPL